MDNNFEQAKKKMDECQMALNDELDSYTLYRFRPSAARLSGRFLVTNRKAFHRKQMRLIVNEYFNKEEGDELTMPLSQQATFPSQTLARTLAEYRELLTKKSDNFMTALIYELETYFQSRFRNSATGRGAQFVANQQSFHREQMLLLIDEFFNSEEDDLSTFPSTATVLSVNQLDVAPNQVENTPVNPSISSVTPSDQQQLVNSGEAQVKEKPIEEDSSTQSREVDNPNTIENIVIVSITEQVQSDCEADSDYGCDDCMADKGRVQTESVMANSEPLPNDDNEELSTAGHGSEMTNNQEIEDATNSLLNQENQVDESVAQMLTDTQQQATVPIANIDQMDNSVNSNFENLNVSQAMDFYDGTGDEQGDSQATLEEAIVDETVNFVSPPSTSTGRRLTRTQKRVNYAEPEEDSLDEYSTVNHNRKRSIPHTGVLPTSKRIAVEPVVAAADEEEVGVEATPLIIIMHHLNCPEAGCTEEFKDKAQLIEHLLGKHQIRAFRCKVKDCALSFASKSQLTDHRKLVHRKLKNWPCDKCETTWKSYKELSSHFCNCHQNGRFECSAHKCDFTGKTRKVVQDHQRNHSCAKYVCTFDGCTTSFKLKSNLTAHLRKHTQERPFACEQCPMAFTTNWELTRHGRTHSGLKPYRCTWPGCDYSASESSSVNGHVRVHHFGLPAKKKEQAKRGIIDTRDAREFIEKIPTN